MMTKLICTCIFLLASHLVLLGQDISATSLRWTCTQTTDLRTQASAAYNCVFITEGAQRVTWLQRNGQVSTAYTVTGTEGSWVNVSSNGSFTYLVSRDGKTGRLILQRSDNEITILVDFSESGQHNIKQSFRVSEVAAQP